MWKWPVEVQERGQEDALPSDIWPGVQEQAGLFSLFLKRWGLVG